MSMTDPVADFLTRIRNACSAGHRRVDVPASKLKVELARLFLENHFIQDYKVLDDGGRGMLRLYLKYHNELPVIRELHRVSKPGLRERDRLVLRRCREAGLPVAVAMAGGYADEVEDIVDIHESTVVEAAAAARAWQPASAARRA